MVGVAGKSQSCNTCRERRLRVQDSPAPINVAPPVANPGPTQCDFRRPVCRKCVKAKRHCGGYDRGERVFVNRTPSSLATDAPSVLSELRALRQPKAASAEPEPEADLCRLFSASSSDSRSFRLYALALLEATYLPKHLSAESLQGSLSWVYGLKDLTRESKLLDTSLFAFCLSQFYVTEYADTSLYLCLNQYNSALQILALDLNDSERRLQEETLAAILLLSTCELFISPGPNGWGTHARGIAEIIRLRGPEMAPSPGWQHLVARMRVVCTLEALTKRQGQMILEYDIWRQVIKECGINGPLDEVFHMIADVPTMLGQAVTLSSISNLNIFTNESAVVVQAMLEKARTIETWIDKFLSDSTTPRFWQMPSRANSPADASLSDKVFPTYFEFEDITVGTPLTMCWAVIAQLLSNVLQIYDLVTRRLDHHIEFETFLAQAHVAGRDTLGPTSASEPQSIEEIKRDGSNMARCVCQSLEYFYQIDMGTWGSHATTYPRWSARQYFRLHSGYERERAWVEDIVKMKAPGTRWGLTMMEFPDIAEPLSVFPKQIQQSIM
ncbi:hypothetical protein F4777DRAFT_38469 [Nemania sp. FL0916]|nr:hypothetical protein F4777DRAFT_38469 [Nemania sp. FL0916]